MFSSSDESEEDDDDDDCELQLVPHFMEPKQQIVRLKNYVEVIIPQYNNIQFKSHFRYVHHIMRRETFQFILDLIRPKLLRKKPGCQTISSDKQLLITIWKMATSDSYRSICEKFDVGRATALKSVRRVTQALIDLAPVFITWPNEERAIKIANGFYATSNFPKVIGAIDGTHINIPAPSKNAESYVNRKGHHSIQLQAVCDHELRFTHCYVGNVGSVHDQRVFRLSEVQTYLNDPTKFSDDCHIIGDAAYTIHEHLLVPYRDNGHLTERQKNYNFWHASARITIERAFGLLKKRFRSLLTVLDMERVDMMPNFILACCVLHNICLIRGDELESIAVDDELEVPHNIGVERDELVAGNRRGQTKRNDICQQLRMRNA